MFSHLCLHVFRDQETFYNERVPLIVLAVNEAVAALLLISTCFKVRKNHNNAIWLQVSVTYIYKYQSDKRVPFTPLSGQVP